MKRQIGLNGKKVVYDLRRRRGVKKLSLSVNCEAEVVLTSPHFVPVFLLEKFLQEKADWLLEKIELFKTIKPNLLKLKGSRQEFLANRKQAYYLAKEKLMKFNQLYNFSYRRICIRNQKTRWGSCASTGTISFNYKIAMLPESLADYIIVHELCHLGEMNHSVKFWHLVAKTVPDWKKRRQELKKIVL